MSCNARWTVGASVPRALHDFAVVVRPKPSVCNDPRARWTDAGVVVNRHVLKGECRVAVEVQGEGAHLIEVRSRGGVYQRAVAHVDDRLVVVLGDSIASGEGNPQGEGKRRWLDAPCHRSRYAGFEQATRALAAPLRKESITFVSLACSGAEIDEGVLGGYRGVQPVKNRTYAPQVDRLERLAGARAGRDRPQRARKTVDAILLSVGANDVNFSRVAKRCAIPFDCRGRADNDVFADLRVLDKQYDELGAELRTKAPESPVLVTEYFDPTHDSNGRICRRSLGFTSERETQLAYEGLLLPLNLEISAAAVRNGWIRIKGIAEDFKRHGICARGSSWIVPLSRSVAQQRDVFGTLHPNRLGHEAIAQRVADPLAREIGLRPQPESAQVEKAAESTFGSLSLELILKILAAVLAVFALALWRSKGLRNAVVRPFRLLFGRTDRPDPAASAPGVEPAERELPTSRQVVVAFIGLVVMFATLTAVVGSAILWVRFWSVSLPADQAVEAVSRAEIAETGGQALAGFAFLGLLAMGVVWLVDADGSWGRPNRRGLGVLIFVELLVATLIGRYRTEQALELVAGFVVAALLLHFLVDRGTELKSVVRDPGLRSKVRGWLGMLLKTETENGYTPLRVAWRLIPLLLLASAIVLAATADGENRLFVIVPLALAVVLFVAPFGAASEGTRKQLSGASDEELKHLEPPRVLLALTALACILILMFRDEAWLAATAIVAALLAGACLVVAYASKQRFAPFGLAVVVSVALFGGAVATLRALDTPEIQPVAAILKDGSAVCGTYVGESDGRLWIARVELPERGTDRRPPSSSGEIRPIDTSRIADRALGPLQPVARASQRAVRLRDTLLNESGDRDPLKRRPLCETQDREVQNRQPLRTGLSGLTAEQRENAARKRLELAQEFQPELILDRRDGFWPVPVRTLFAMQDRRARACREVGSGDCVALTTQGAFPWSGGKGEAIDYPAENETDDQHDLMTDALGSVDPAKTARVYYLVAGTPGETAVTLQYWYFYPFNYQDVARAFGSNLSTGGYHEGDFEASAVLLSKSGKPRYVWMPRHDKEDRTLAWDDPSLEREGNHARLFVARGSHATYDNCSVQFRDDESPLPNFIDDYPTCDPEQQMQLSPTATPLTDLARVAWGCWAGIFGATKGTFGGSVIPHRFNNGPKSPLWQQDRVGNEKARPCVGVDDPGDRDGPGEEVVEETQSAARVIRAKAGKLDARVDECSDWEVPPGRGTYMMACNPAALVNYVKSGFDDPGDATLRIYRDDVVEPVPDERVVPAVRSDHAGAYLSAWRIGTDTPTSAIVYAACRQGKRVVAARFGFVGLSPDAPLTLWDRNPDRWELRRPDGSIAAEAEPYVARRPKAGGGRYSRIACSP